MGGLIGALVYSVLMWGVFFQATPRVIAWLGQRQASASQDAAASKINVAPPAPEKLKPAGTP